MRPSISTDSLWLLPGAAGVVLAAGYLTQPLPVPLPIPNLLALVPLLHWLDAPAQDGARRRFRGGLVFGVVLWAISLSWISAMLEISWLASLMYLVLLTPFAVCAALTITLAGWMRRRTGGSYALILPVCWLPFEWLRTWGDLRMTADHLGHSMADHPFLVQFADLVGPYGVGAFVLVVNALLYEALRERGTSRGRRRALALLGLLVAVLAYDTWRWVRPPVPEATLRVAFVQPNISLADKHDPAQDRVTWRILATLTRRAAAQGARLVVWPETARPRPLYHLLDDPTTLALPDVQGLARRTETTILTGVEYVRARTPADVDLYNAAMVVGPDGAIDPRWTAKVYLVPFVERTPFMPVLGRILSGEEGEMRWLSGRFLPGPRDVVIPAAGVPVGVLVCYEELYPDLAVRLRNAGAALQVVITNDAWFGRSFFQVYQADVLRMRAIENRSSFVRAANTGISGFVDPLGRYHDWTGLFVPAVRVHDVPITRVRTVYDRLGDAVAWLSIAGLAVGILLARRGRT